MSDNGSNNSPLSQIRDIAFIAAIYLFFCGYVYRSAYYQAFALPVNTSLADAISFYVNSHTVFWDESWIAAQFGIVFTVLYYSTLRYYGRASARYVVYASGIAAFFVLAYMATLAADKESATYKNWSSTDATLTLGIKESSRHNFDSPSGRQFLASIDAHEMHLFATNSTYAFITDRATNPNGHLGDLKIYVIPLQEISHYEIDLPTANGTPSPAVTPSLTVKPGSNLKTKVKK